MRWTNFVLDFAGNSWRYSVMKNLDIPHVGIGLNEAHMT